MLPLQIPSLPTMSFGTLKAMTELSIPELPSRSAAAKPFRGQLLKWVGNKQRFAAQIVSYFPQTFGTYYEPFLGSGAVLATLRPSRAVASDTFAPLMEIWHMLQADPDTLKAWYRRRWERFSRGDRKTRYEAIRRRYNAQPNGADLLFLCRACYGGVVRFRKTDGHISTPCGVHPPLSPETFAARVDEWYRRVKGTTFRRMDYTEAFALARRGDLIYCDPPYRHTQSILYGAQEFCLDQLFRQIGQCAARGVRVALSIDGTKQSGRKECPLQIPEGLFKREILVNCGRSMLKRFQMPGQSLHREEVRDRLLLTY